MPQYHQNPDFLFLLVSSFPTKQNTEHISWGFGKCVFCPSPQDTMRVHPWWGSVCVCVCVWRGVLWDIFFLHAGFRRESLRIPLERPDNISLILVPPTFYSYSPVLGFLSVTLYGTILILMVFCAFMCIIM